MAFCVLRDESYGTNDIYVLRDEWRLCPTGRVLRDEWHLCPTGRVAFTLSKSVSIQTGENFLKPSATEEDSNEIECVGREFV